LKNLTIMVLTVLLFAVPVQADPVLYEGELITSWTGTGQDENPYRSKVCSDYNLPRCQQKDHVNPPHGKFKIYFKCTLPVLNQMEADRVQIVWSGEIEDEK